MLLRIILLLLALLAVGAVLVAADWWICLPQGATADYVGSRECARCHEKEMELWTGSDHDLAMDPATAETVLGNFDDRQFTHYAVTSKLFRREDKSGDKFFVTTDGPTGEMETFEIKYTFGVWPLQQYLVEFPDGRVQCLGIAWDTVTKEWFHLYPDEEIPADDVLHWTRPLQNWNYMCAECHTTNLQKSYDLQSGTYHTTWSEIDVGCETCHGPGSLHVKLADSYGFFWDRRIGFGLPRLKDPDPRVEIETCAPCHSRRRIVYPNLRGGKKLPDDAGQKFLDYYLPELLDGNLYYADGQILEEDYVYGSFIQSKMYRQGVRCTDCHDPHTGRVKFTEPGAPRGQPIDNRLCTGCHTNQHPAGKYDTQIHHHHPDSSKPGTKCVECHMPETTYMVVDPRRDHSMRNPRPDLTVRLGIPNACNGCHHDESKGETPEWADKWLKEWYPQRNEPEHFAYAIAAGRQVKPEGERALEAVTRRKDESAMVRASAILLLARYPGRTGQTAAFRGLEDPDALVRAAAVRSLQHPPPDELRFLKEIVDIQARLRRIDKLDDRSRQMRLIRELNLPREQLRRIADIADPLEVVPALEEYCGRLTPMLADPIRAVRIEAARVVSQLPLQVLEQQDREAFDAALAEYMTGQESVGDQAAAHLNVAVVYTNLGQLDKAEQEYQTAIRIDPRFVPARINLAMLYDQQGQKAEAVGQFRKVIELEPELAEAHYSLGLLLAEDKEQLEEAAEKLAEAVRLAPDNPRMRYNYGLALQHLGRVDEAEESLKTACELAPGEFDFPKALAILYVQQKRWAQAIRCAETAVEIRPGDPQRRMFLEQLKRQQQQEEEDK